MPTSYDTEDGSSPAASQSPGQDPTDPSYLQMRSIVKRYGKTVALDGVDLDVKLGEIHALLGENGAGKSTLMHVLAGLTRPDHGSILLNQLRVSIESPQQARSLGLAMVHQHFTLVPAFTIEENLALDQPETRIRWNYEPSRAARNALERAAALGWRLDPKARVADLPVGLQQRVEIAKALATNARVLIFDEPTAVLVGDEVDELFTMFRRLREEGHAVILIAHKLAEILAVADRVTVLRRGHNVATTRVADTGARQLAKWMVGADIADEPSPPLASEQVDPSYASDTRAVTAAFSARKIVIHGDRGERAISGVDLQVAPGEIFGIGGVDGNGQTELAEAVVGLRPIESGTISWQQSAFKPGVAPRVGYIPQDRRRAGLALTLSIETNLLFDAVHAPEFRFGPFLRRRALHQAAADLIARFDIRTTDPSLPVSSLSGGNQQKIVVARALYRNPDWIVAVNPTRGLDIGATRFVHHQLRVARQRGAAILVLSTDMDELHALADRAAILANGKLTDFPLRSDAAELGLLLGGLSLTPSSLGGRQ